MIAAALAGLAKQRGFRHSADCRPTRNRGDLIRQRLMRCLILCVLTKIGGRGDFEWRPISSGVGRGDCGAEGVRRSAVPWGWREAFRVLVLRHKQEFPG